MNDRYIIALLCMLVTVMTGRLLLERAQKKLDNETKLKLLNDFSSYRKVAYIVYPILIVLYFAAYKLMPVSYNKWLVWIYVSLIVLVSSITGRSIFKKLKASEIPEHYRNTFLIARGLTLFGIIAFMFILFSSFGGNSKMEAEALAYNAYKASIDQNYSEALTDYNEAIKLNGNNSTYFANRGTTKYYLHDLPGACADWQKAFEMGNDDAKKNLDNFCK